MAHYNAPPYILLHYTSLPYNALHCVHVSHCITLHLLHYTLHYTTSHPITLRHTASQCVTLDHGMQCSSVHVVSVRYVYQIVEIEVCSPEC